MVSQKDDNTKETPHKNLEETNIVKSPRNGYLIGWKDGTKEVAQGY